MILSFTMYQISRLSDTMYAISPSAFDNKDQISIKNCLSRRFFLFLNGQHHIENKINVHFIGKRCLHQYIKMY